MCNMNAARWGKILVTFFIGILLQSIFVSASGIRKFSGNFSIGFIRNRLFPQIIAWTVLISHGKLFVEMHQRDKPFHWGAQFENQLIQQPIISSNVPVLVWTSQQSPMKHRGIWEKDRCERILSSVYHSVPLADGIKKSTFPRDFDLMFRYAEHNFSCLIFLNQSPRVGCPSMQQFEVRMLFSLVSSYNLINKYRHRPRTHTDSRVVEVVCFLPVQCLSDNIQYEYKYRYVTIFSGRTVLHKTFLMPVWHDGKKSSPISASRFVQSAIIVTCSR